MELETQQVTPYMRMYILQRVQHPAMYTCIHLSLSSFDIGEERHERVFAVTAH